MVRNGNKVVSGLVCWSQMSLGRRKCAGWAPGMENDAWKGCRGGGSGMASLKHGPWEVIRLIRHTLLHVCTV